MAGQPGGRPHVLRPRALLCPKVLLKTWEKGEKLELTLADELIYLDNVNGILTRKGVERRKPTCTSEKGQWQARPT